MGKIIEIPFTSNLIEFIADRLINIAGINGVSGDGHRFGHLSAEETGFLQETRFPEGHNGQNDKQGRVSQYDFSQTAVIFPHHRPGFYLRQAMAERLGHPFFPPRIFSMDDFMAFLAEKVSPGPAGLQPAPVNSLDSAYLLCQAAANIPDNPWQKADSSFNQFLFWGLKLDRVMEELDIEMVENKRLKSIDMGDLWGPNVARHAGILMNHLAEIRQSYHTLLEERRLTTRGRNYAMAAENIEEGDISPFKAVYFAGLFAMTRAEKTVIRHLLGQPEVSLIRQNDGTKWSPFEEMDSWDCGLRNADCGLQIADCGMRNADCRLRIADCGLRIADYRLRIADCGMRNADCGLRIADCGDVLQPETRRPARPSRSGGPSRPGSGNPELETDLPETRNPKLETKLFLHSAFNTHSEVVGLRDILTADPQSEIRNPKSASADPQSEIRNPQSASANPQSEIRNPKSASADPQSEIRNPQSTAIVLPEPESLIPLLSEVMTSLKLDYNITMGYPAVRTPVYALLDLFIKLQESKRGNTYYLPDYLALLMHPYLKNIRHTIKSTHTRILIHSIEESLLAEGKTFIDLSAIEQRQDIFEKASLMTQRKAPIQDFKDALTGAHDIFIRKMDGVRTLAQLAAAFEEILVFLLRHSPAARYPFSGEFFHSFFLLLDKIKGSLIKDEEFDAPKDLFDLFRHVAKEEHISFRGIPLKGLQILGLLETRALNFDRVFLLSANEGILPAVESFDSLLPLSLRGALGMPLHYQNEEIYRYHFHHLISSAREVHIFYRQIEKESRSRFVERLVWEEEKKRGQLGVLKVMPVELNVSLYPSGRFEVAKSPEILHILQTIDFSATGLNSYLKCPAQFYFTKVLKLKEKERMTEELDVAEIGTILHKVMEILYQPFAGKGALGEQEYACLEKNLAGVLEKVFMEKFGELRGEQYLLKEMALDRLKRYILLEKEEFVDKIRIISTEEELTCSLELEDGTLVRLNGRADRIDRLSETDMIVDYKSGSLDHYSFNAAAFNRVLSSRDEMKEEIKSLQLPFYALLYQRVRSIPPKKINCKLISLRNPRKGDEKLLFNKPKKGGEETNREEFLEGYFLPTIKNLIGEILNPEIPFGRDDKGEGCQYCPFPTFCRKAG